jgi:aspartyl-tRNA(Asn)/glutamyl-tRNA(Gln) amidotransferase subunit A
MKSQQDAERDHPLWSLSATALATIYRNGDADPVEVVTACLARIDQLNPALNALVFIDRAGAIAAAEQSRKRWAAGEPLSELDGVPVTVKDNMFVAGMPATLGSELFADFVPDDDELPVARLRSAGMIILGKTNTPEFAMAAHTDNRVFGRTCNPWDLSLTPGGSSGGAVAALMGGFAPLALATDAGGSIRRPASHTGCVGLKPSTGVVARRGGFRPLASDLQAVGPIARCVDDLTTVLAILCEERLGPTPWRRLKIGAFAVAADCPVDPEVIDVHDRTKERLCELGHQLHEIVAPYDPEHINVLSAAATSAGIARIRAQHPDRWEQCVGEIAARAADAGSTMSAVDYIQVIDAITDFRWHMDDLLNDYDIVVTPTAAALAWNIEHPFPPTIAGKPAGPRSSAVFTTFVNVAGLAGINVPAGISKSQLPIGMQFVAGHRREATLLGLAAQFEARWPWPRLAPTPALEPLPG